VARMAPRRAPATTWSIPATAPGVAAPWDATEPARTNRECSRSRPPRGRNCSPR
jgi:hypothetical protein